MTVAISEQARQAIVAGQAPYAEAILGIIAGKVSDADYDTVLAAVDGMYDALTSVTRARCPCFPRWP